MLRLNSIPASVFDATGTIESKIKVNGSNVDLSRKDIVATGRLVACEYFGAMLNNDPRNLEKYNSHLQGTLDYATLSARHMEKKLLFCAAMANKLSGKDEPVTIEQVKNNAGYAKDPFFLRTLAEIDRDVIQPLFFDVINDVGMGLMQWDAAPFGRTTEIEIGSNDVFLFEDGGFGSSRSTTKNYLYKKSIAVTPKMFTCNATIKWYQDLVNGDAGRYYAAIMNGMFSKIYAKMMASLKNAIGTPGTANAYIPEGLTAQTYSTGNWLTITDKLAAANGIRVNDLLAVGTRSALANLLPVDGTGGAITGLQYGLGKDWFENGYLAKAAQVDLLAISPVIVPGTQNKDLLTIDTGNDIYIFGKAGRGYAPMRGVYAEGSPIMLEMEASKTADFTIDINVSALFDIIPLFASKVAVIRSVYPST